MNVVMYSSLLGSSLLAVFDVSLRPYSLCSLLTFRDIA